MGKRKKRQLPLYLDADTIERLAELTERRGCTTQAALREAVDNMLLAAGVAPRPRPAVPTPAAPAEPFRPRVDPGLREAKAEIVNLELTMMGRMARSLERPGLEGRPLRTVDELLAKAKELGLR